MKQRSLSLSLALLLCLGCAAQNRNAAKFSTVINRDNAYAHLSVLASDAYEGRETGKKGAWMAADYIRAYFKNIGLTGPVNGDYFQPVDLVTADGSKLRIAGPDGPRENEVKVRAENVLGFLEGSDPVLKNEILVITAHYDHIGLTSSGTDKVNNGADDDGSGTTAVLMIADAFVKAKKAGKGPKRSILFMTVVGEEKGLLGSEWYSEHPVLPLEKTITDLNIDMIGRVDKAHEHKPDYVYIIGSDMLSSDLNAVGIKANEENIKMNLDMKYNNRTDPNQFYYRSDHYNFAKHGIPVIFYFSGVHADYHRPGDEISKIDFDLLSKRAQLVYFTAWELANSASRPAVDKNSDGTLKK